jgi:hypothetical protein
LESPQTQRGGKKNKSVSAQAQKKKKEKKKEEKYDMNLKKSGSAKHGGAHRSY